MIRAKDRLGDAVLRSAPWWRIRAGSVLIGALLLGVLSACGGGTTPTTAPTAAPTVAPTVAPTAVATVPAATTTTTRAAVPATSGPATVTVPRAATPSASATRETMDYPDVVRAALAQAATDLGVAPDQLTIVAVEARDWPDSSLGCPQPGRAYAQIVTPGYRVVVEANGRQYDYHTNRAAMIVRCTP